MGVRARVWLPVYEIDRPHGEAEATYPVQLAARFGFLVLNSHGAKLSSGAAV